LTFLAFLFALDRESSKKSGQIFAGIYVLLMALTFLDWHGQIKIPDLLTDNGLHIDLWNAHSPVTSFFENRNPYAVVSVGVFYWSLASLRHSWILSSLGIGAALYSVFITGSRNGILTLVLCLLLLLILTFIQIRKALTAFILVLAVTIVFGIGYYSIHNQTINRTNVTLNQLLNVKTYKDLESLDLRFILFRSAFESGIANSPILGSGTKTFGHEVFSKSVDLDKYNNAGYKTAYNSHNALLTIWIEMGWVGLIAVLIFLWLWFYPSLRGPSMLMMPMVAVCVGQILDYFVWEIFFMAFQSFFFASFASTIYFIEDKSTAQSSDNSDY